ncbi:MAG TPA: hypothetical protein VLC52_15545 [Anaerolineae bacterium]|nr:hypothetical protein [Anaerolineae bacterium]
MLTLRAALLFCYLAILTLRGPAALAQSPEPPPEPTEDRLAMPTLPAEPTQVELGAHMYRLVCMACHGDRGQGLTDEWRAAWSTDEQYCWQRKCHAANYPPGGFELVRFVPAIVGEDRLVRFQTAAGLHEYIRTRMPWQAPGSLEEDEYWQITAFVLLANGVIDGTETIGPENAAEVPIDVVSGEPAVDLPPMAPPEMPPPHGSAGRGWLAALLGVLLVVVVAGWVAWRAGRRPRP